MSILRSAAPPSTSPGRLLDPAIEGLGLGLLAATIWGSYLALARAGVSAGLEATDVAAIRYGVAGLLMLPWLAMNTASVMAIGLARGAVLALLAGPLFVIVGVSGYTFAPLAHGAVLQPAGLTLGSMALAVLVLGDRPPLERIIGIAIIISGLLVIAGPGLFAGGTLAPLGDALFVASGLMWAAFTVLGRRWGVSPIAGTAVVSVLSALVYMPPYLALTGAERLLAAEPGMLLAQIIVQGVLSGVVAVIAYTRAVQLLGAGRAATFPALVPAVAILIGIPVALEVPTFGQMAGLGLASLGLLVAVGAIGRSGIGQTK